MQRLTVLVCFFIVTILGTVTFGQNQPTIVFKSEPKKPEKQKQFWKPSSEFTAINKIETENKVGIVESPFTSFSSKYVNSDERKEFTLESTHGFAVKNIIDDRYVNFRMEAKRKFSNNFSIAADSQFMFTRFKGIGRVGAKVTKSFGNESASVQPFSKIDYYFPLSNQINQVSYQGFNHSGFTWSNGINSEVEYKQFVFQNRTQLILDNGAILPGERTLFNTEIEVGYKFNRMCVGPILGYTHLLSGEFPHRNSIVAGVFVRYQ